MTLPYLYGLPLPILASWRGYYQETIPAQIPFNEKIPDLLGLYQIPCTIIRETEELHHITSVISDAWIESRPHVALISPKVWKEEGGYCAPIVHPTRVRTTSLVYQGRFKEPVMQRADAIDVLASLLSNELVISNIGVPSKELYHARDRPGNFYMLGSYTQASPLGLGVSLGTARPVVVIDGDGSVLGTAALPIIAAESRGNLIIVCLDNGVYGSTGNQCSPAYHMIDLELLAQASGFRRTFKVHTPEELQEAYTAARNGGLSFIHVIIRPGNRLVPNIPLSPGEIKSRFTSEVRKNEE
jgi:sulfopyruvate decarboxylase subunit beta